MTDYFCNEETLEAMKERFEHTQEDEWTRFDDSGHRFKPDPLCQPGDFVEDRSNPEQ